MTILDSYLQLKKLVLPHLIIDTGRDCMTVRSPGLKWARINCDKGLLRAIICQVRAGMMRERYYSREDDFDRLCNQTLKRNLASFWI